MASQPNFDDLKECRTGLDNFLDTLPAIKHLALIPERISKIEWRDDIRFVDKDLMQRDR